MADMFSLPKAIWGGYNKGKNKKISF